MNESDTVFGATDNLMEVIRETWLRYHPSAIFIASSCVSGVIGEDLDQVVSGLKNEIPIPLALVHCEGFKTRIWATGFDAAFHAILTSIVKPPEKRTNIVNIINFYGSARKEITDIFRNLGVEPLFILANSTVEQLSRLSESVATVSTCGTLGTYLRNGLQDQYGVPYVQSLQPHGIAGFESWLSELGKVLHKEAEVEAYLTREREIYLPKIEAVRKKLAGIRAVIGMGPGFNFNTSRVLQELGIEIAYSAAWHFDKQYDDEKAPSAFRYLVEKSPDDFPMTVCDLQNFEVLNILNTVKPDIFFSRHTGSTVWAMKLGIPALCLYDEYAIFGYRGLLQFAYSVLDVVTNRSFTDNLSKRVKLPYTDWWLKQGNDHFFENPEAGHV
jgi:nitrogenase molybdenum-iron protein alpha chain